MKQKIARARGSEIINSCVPGDVYAFYARAIRGTGSILESRSVPGEIIKHGPRC